MRNQKRFLLGTVFIFCVCAIIFIYNEKATVSKYLSEHSVIEDIYFVPQEDEARKVYLLRNDIENIFHAYITAKQDEQIKIYFNFCEKIIIDGHELKNGNVLPELTEGQSYWIQAVDWTGEVCETEQVVFYFMPDVPTVFITTNSGSMVEINDNKEYEESAYFAVYTPQKVLDSLGECTVTGRGNSTWGKEQKPYSIDLVDAEDILGMEATADWALLCNYGNELPQLKNKVMFEIAQEMGIENTPQSESVNLYLNGQYNGLYLLTQRININDKSAGLSKKNDRTYLLEFDERYEEEKNYFLTEKQSVVIKEPKIVSQAQALNIEKLVSDAERAIYNRDGMNQETGKHYLDYIDMDSWSKAFMIQNYFTQWDIEFASFYFYKPIGVEKFYAGPPWDFDMTCGKMYYGNYPKLSAHTLWIEDFKGKWLQNMVKHEEFQEYTRGQWLDNYSLAISRVLTEEYGEIVKEFAPAVEMDKIRWNKADKDFQGEADKLYDWLVKRQAFLDDYYANPENYCAVTFEFAWGPIPYYVLKNTALNFLPCDKYGETDKYTSKFGYEDIVGWQNAEGQEVSADDIIEENVTYYPIYK